MKTHQQSFELLAASLFSMFLVTQAQAGDFSGKLEVLRTGTVKERKQAKLDLMKAGYPAARKLAKVKEGDEDFQKLRGDILAPFKARLTWDEWVERGVTEKLLGRLSGHAFWLGKKVGKATMTATLDADSQMNIVTAIDGELREWKANLALESLYDEHFQLLKSKLEVRFYDSKRKDRFELNVVMTRLSKKSTLTHHVFRVEDKTAKRTKEMRLEKGVVMGDLFVVLGRGLDFKSRKRQKLVMDIINPGSTALEKIPVTIQSERREKTVVKGGARVPGLKLLGSAPGLPKEVGDPKFWIDENQKPLKARFGAFTIYGISKFEKIAPAKARDKSAEPKTKKKQKYF